MIDSQNCWLPIYVIDRISPKWKHYRNVVFSTFFSKYLDLTVFPDVDPIEVVCGVSQ